MADMKHRTFQPIEKPNRNNFCWKLLVQILKKSCHCAIENHKYEDRHRLPSTLIDLRLEVRITLEPSLTATSPQRPRFWQTVHTLTLVQTSHYNIHFLLFPRKPLWRYSTVVELKSRGDGEFLLTNPNPMQSEVENRFFSIQVRNQPILDCSLKIYVRNLVDRSPRLL